MTAYPTAQMGTTVVTSCKCARQSCGGDGLVAGTCEVRHSCSLCGGAGAEGPSRGLGGAQAPGAAPSKDGQKADPWDMKEGMSCVSYVTLSTRGLLATEALENSIHILANALWL